MKILYLDLENIMRPEHIFHPGARGKFSSRAAGFCADLAYILVFGYKWHGEASQSIQSTKAQFKADPLTDKHLLARMAEVVDQADVIVTWYGKGHDVPFLVSRLAQQGIYIDPKVRHIDLYQVAKRTLRLSSNKLDSVARFFGLEQKMKVSPELWARCWRGDYEALTEMATYCRQDCDVLANVYEKMLALGVNLPHIGKHKHPEAEHSCPSCGSLHYVGKGRRVTKLRKYQRLQCKECGTSYIGDEI